MKYLSLFSIVGVSSALFADGSAAMQEMPQTAPASSAVMLASPNYQFGISFKALIMQPFANNLDYAAEALPFNYGDANPALSPSWVIEEISPDFHFGFDVGIAGIFKDAKSTLMLNWVRYHSSNDSKSHTVPTSDDMIGPFFEIGPDASTYKQSKGSVNFHFDEVNLNYGTFVQFGSRLHTNLFAGVSFARILQHRFSSYSDLSGDVVRTIKVPAKFTGAGPQIGIDFNYKIVKGLQFVGNTRASLYVGSFKDSTTYSTASTALIDLGDPSPNIQSTTVHKKMGVVPGLEGNLGLAYEYLFRDHYLFKIEAGYQAQVYINAIRSIDMGSEVALSTEGSVGSATVGVYARTFERTVSDFGLAGPYASVSLGF